MGAWYTEQRWALSAQRHPNARYLPVMLISHRHIIASLIIQWALGGSVMTDVAQPLPCPATQTQRIVPSCNDGFLFGVAIAVDDDRAAVGRFDELGGRVTPLFLDQSQGLWNFGANLRPTDLAPHDAFGNAAALQFESSNGRWLLAVGSPTKSNLAVGAGKAYVFQADGQGQWAEDAGILPQVGVPDGWFGYEVAWATVGQRSFLIVGGPGSDGDQIVGSAYVFEENGQGVWTQQAHLQAPDGSPDDAFGYAIASAENNGDTVLAIGAPAHVRIPQAQPGTAYLYSFDESANEWTLEMQVEAPDPYDQDQFGTAVAVAPVTDSPGYTHRVAIGRENEGGFGAPAGPGGVYLYLRRVDGTWQQEAHLTPPVANPNDMFFGHAVDLASDGSGRLLIGAPENRDFGNACGAAYIFERDEQTGEWAATQALYGRESDALDVVGVSLGLGSLASDGLAVLGAHTTQCEGGLQTDAVGAVYSFDLDPGNGGNCPAPVITLQKVPDCSSGPGGELEVRWFQATPDQRARIALLYAKRTGNFIIPNGNPCSGTSLQLGQLGLQVAYVGSAGQFGAGRLKRTVPRTVCGGYLQLVDITRCATSNVVRIE